MAVTPRVMEQPLNRGPPDDRAWEGLDRWHVSELQSQCARDGARDGVWRVRSVTARVGVGLGTRT